MSLAVTIHPSNRVPRILSAATRQSAAATRDATQEAATFEGPDPVDIAVGREIRARRKVLGISQSQLAEALGLTFQQVQKYERAANRVSASKLYAIAEALKCSAADLMPPSKHADEPDPIRETVLKVLAMPGGREVLEDLVRLNRRELRAVASTASILCQADGRA